MASEKSMIEEMECLEKKDKEKSEKSPGIKFDGKKLRWTLLPWKEVEDTVEVLEYGSQKYSDNNWMQVRPTRRYLDAALRHLAAYAMGEKKDPETGFSHLAHAMCNLLYLLWFDNNGIED